MEPSTAPAMSAASIAKLGVSSKVIDRVIKKLPGKGVKISRSELLKCLTVEPEPQTNLTTIEVVRINKSEAAAIAQTESDQLKAAYAEMASAKAVSTRKFVEARVKSAKAKLLQSDQSLRTYLQANGSKPKDTKLARLKAESVKASAEYGRLRAQLDMVRIEEARVNNTSVLKTIDPVYVSPAR